MSDRFSPESVARQLDNCTFCPKMSRHACPVANAVGRETYTPQAKMDRLNQMRLGHRDWSADGAEPIYACTGCRNCTRYCAHGNEPGLVLFAGRAEANRRGAAHPNLANYPDRFRNRDRRLAETLRRELPREALTSDAVLGFFPGCDSIDKGVPELLDALALFRRLGGEHIGVVDAGQGCGGYPLLAAGYPDMFRWHASRLANSLKPFRTVVVNCSACVYTLRSLYPAEGLQLSTEILSVPEFVVQSVSRIPEPEKKPLVYYHDPCYHARYSGVVEAPRQILSRIATVKEFGWAGADADCCGGGGLVPKTLPDVADSMARRRLREVANRGGGTVVTSCATCTFMLRRNAPEGVNVYDLAGYVEANAPAQDD